MFVHMIKEIWKDIPGWEGWYRVSNLGRVRRIKRHGKSCSCNILKQREVVKGYMAVCLCKDGVQKWMRVHRLVAMAFIPNPNNYPIINHKDENVKNNCVSNLEWCTVAYNNVYGTARQRRAESCSKPIAQYTPEGKLIATYINAKEAAIKNGFHRGAINFCCNGKRNQHRGFIWKFL